MFDRLPSAKTYGDALISLVSVQKILQPAEEQKVCGALTTFQMPRLYKSTRKQPQPPG